MAALVACQCKYNHPFVLIAKERSDAVLAHVRSYCERVNIVFLEECACVHGTCVANVTALGVCYDEVVWIVLLEIFDCLLKRDESLHAECLIECEVWLVRYTVRSCGVDDGFVESENRVFLVEYVCRNLLEVGVKTHAQKRALGLYLIY